MAQKRKKGLLYIILYLYYGFLLSFLKLYKYKKTKETPDDYKNVFNPFINALDFSFIIIYIVLSSVQIVKLFNNSSISVLSLLITLIVVARRHTDYRRKDYDYKYNRRYLNCEFYICSYNRMINTEGFLALSIIIFLSTIYLRRIFGWNSGENIINIFYGIVVSLNTIVIAIHGFLNIAINTFKAEPTAYLASKENRF